MTRDELIDLQFRKLAADVAYERKKLQEKEARKAKRKAFFRKLLGLN